MTTTTQASRIIQLVPEFARVLLYMWRPPNGRTQKGPSTLPQSLRARQVEFREA